MSRLAAPDPPVDLSEPSQALWPRMVADLRAVTGAAEVDLLLLADLLRAVDRLSAVRDVLGAEGLTVPGSKGQTRGHPLLTVEASLRAEVAGSMERLGLAPTPARSNWTKVTGSGRLVRDALD